MTDDCMNDSQIRIELARLDERQKALAKENERTEQSNREAVEIASSELARRLDILNHAHQEAIRVQGTYVPREMYERDRREDAARFRTLEDANQNLQGKLWLPFIVVGGVAAGIAVAITKLIGH